VVPTASATGTSGARETVKLPAPTAWPIVLAFGVTLLFAGMLTSASISVLGTILIAAGCVGWFKEVLPHEKEETVEVRGVPVSVSTSHRAVERLPMAPELPRPLLPLEIYPVSAGIKGGLAGSVAMAALACLYGLLKDGSSWYPINLLAASCYGRSFNMETAWLDAFHLGNFSLAFALHLLISLLVGLLYGAVLPMFPRRPIFLGGVVAPVLWTGILHSILGLLNPLLDERIDWPWFIASQVAFGIVAGLVVARLARVHTRQFVPFLMRAGIEAPGYSPEKRGGDESK